LQFKTYFFAIDFGRATFSLTAVIQSAPDRDDICFRYGWSQCL